MKLRRMVIVWVPVLACVLPCVAGTAGNADVTKVTRLMPTTFPLSIIVVDAKALEGSTAAVAKRLDPGYSGDGTLGPLKEVKTELGDLSKWIDFHSPIGMAGSGFGESTPPLVWLRVPDFAGKVKTLSNAKQEESVWHLTLGNGSDMYMAQRDGDYVVLSPNKGLLATSKPTGTSLADVLKPRMNLLQGRDALVHVQFDAIRPLALGALAQANQMAQMMGMMMAQQSGADPMALTAMLTGLLDGVKNFVGQVASIDITVGIGRQSIDATVAAAFADGAIKNYLAKQKPASIPFFTHLPKQRYFVAMGMHVPGKEAPFFDYLIDKILNAMPAATPAQGEQADQAKVQTNPLKEAAEVAHAFWRAMEGMTVVMDMSPGGMKMSGTYVTSDAPGFLALLKKLQFGSSPLIDKFGFKGPSYESLKSMTIGGVSVEQFALKMNSAGPAAATLKTLYGENARMGLGIAKGHVRFCLGDDADITRTFSGTASESLATEKYVAAALAALPAKRNAVVLADPVVVMQTMNRMTGGPTIGEVSPGPPFAISASLAGEPARLDIHIPIRALERVVQATGQPAPM